MSRTFASLFAALAIVAVSVAPASAERHTVTTSISVPHADLNLNRVEGAKTLSMRLDRAVDRVCGKSPARASMAMRRMVDACRKDATTLAVAEIDSPMLTALYYGRRGTQFAAR